MKKMQYSEIKGDSTGFYTLLTVLVLLLSSGLSAAWFMEHNGHYVTGMDNVRDAIPFPRTPGSADF